VTALQPAVGEHAEIGAARDRIAVARCQLPGEADAVVVRIHFAQTAEAMAGGSAPAPPRASRRLPSWPSLFISGST